MRFLLLPLLLLSLTAPALAQMKFVLQYQDQFGSWKRWGEKHNEGDAYRTAKARAKQRARGSALLMATATSLISFLLSPL